MRSLLLPPLLALAAAAVFVMPIEIRELHIKVDVNEPTQAKGGAAAHLKAFPAD